MTDLQKFKNDFTGKKVTIMGLGLLGRGINDARFFAEIGAKVTVTDLKTTEELEESIKQLANLPIEFHLGGHQEQDFIKTDLVLKGAGVPINSKFIQIAIKHNIPVEMDESLFAKYSSAKLIGITGTRGKTTTTHMLYEVLKAQNKKVFLGGNVFGVATLPLLKETDKDSLVVLELSSWQLRGFGENKISPHLAIFTNIYPDHMDYYEDMEEYLADKKLIYTNQTKENNLILNELYKNDPRFAKIPSQVNYFSIQNLPTDFKFSYLLGNHNLENAAAVLMTTEYLNLNRDKTLDTLQQFKGIEHRLEYLGQMNNISFYNDTTSTTPVAGIAALNSFSEPLVLIAGGAAKKLEMQEFAKTIVKKTKKIILLQGTATPELSQLIESEINKTDCNNPPKILGPFTSLDGAVAAAVSVATAGDSILLSPGCASFGMFKNEFDRGQKFKKIIEKYLSISGKQIEN